MSNYFDSETNTVNNLKDYIKRLKRENRILKKKLNRSEEEKHKYFFLYNFSPLSVFIMDFDTKVIECNKNFSDLLKTDEIDHDFYFHSIIHNDYSDTFYFFCEHLKTDDEAEEIILKIKIDDKGYRYIKFKGKKISFFGKNFVIASISDINKEYLLKRKLLLEKTRAEKADRLKTEFLANMSHEIRTPITTVMGYSDLLYESDLNDIQLNYNNMINRASNHLLSLINDILDISRIEAGELITTNKSFSPDELVNEVKDYFYPQFEKCNKLELITELSGEKDFNIKSDYIRIRQIFINLISNALKFTHKGFIKIGVKKDGNNAIFFVSDTGDGIPEEKQKMIFDKFAQIDSGFSRKYGGAGLGLYISKKMVEILGGYIKVDSQQNDITTFSFTIPNGEEDKDFEILKNNYLNTLQREKDKILIIEDNPENLQFMRLILKNAGFSVLSASKAEEGMELIKKNKDIGVTLIDLEHSGCNNESCTLKLKRFFQKEDKDMLFVFIMKRQDKNRKNKALELNIDAILFKPFNTLNFIEFISCFYQKNHDESQRFLNMDV